MQSPRETRSDLRIKFELHFRGRRTPLLPWLVICMVIVGIAGRLMQMWIET